MEVKEFLVKVMLAEVFRVLLEIKAAVAVQGLLD
jgi:hypothetical protein